MRKVLIAIIILIACATYLALESFYSDNKQIGNNIMQGRFIIVEKVSPRLFIAKDNQTNVLYWFNLYDGAYRMACPMYTSNGEINVDR